ncbi:MAG: hypothetical protein UT05_C0012G0012 [Parcubacteria group bacterium GW2011_GWF2_38_76]|nr:MAG: hypothetical protein UT05_C0012G0012 [Parcubacteria group bacterium GW2011_GWF2_38_76]HBM46062.1 hypothetical protein [Patescibacteria group bacterium]
MFKNLILFYVAIVLAIFYFGYFFGILSATFGGMLAILMLLIGLNIGKELFGGIALTEEDLEIGSTYEIESTSPHSSYFSLAEIVEGDTVNVEAKVVNRYFHLPCLGNLNPIVGPRVGDKFKVTQDENGKIEILPYNESNK